MPGLSFSVVIKLLLPLTSCFHLCPPHDNVTARFVSSVFSPRLLRPLLSSSGFLIGRSWASSFPGQQTTTPTQPIRWQDERQLRKASTARGRQAREEGRYRREDLPTYLPTYLSLPGKCGGRKEWREGESYLTTTTISLKSCDIHEF